MSEMPSIGWSNFALKRHQKGSGNTYPCVDHNIVLQSVRDNWKNRYPGQGETGLDRKIVVPVEPRFFRSSTIKITEQMREAPISPIKAKVCRRQKNEDLYVGNSIRRFWAWLQRINVEPETPNFATVVLYSVEALLENGGERSTDMDWEVVCIIASSVEKEPMPPLTMARNMLEKVGGTKSTYTAEEFAESIYYWSQRIRAGD